MKTIKKRLCVALPGINYTPYSPYVLSTLPMLPYWQEHYEITVVYRKILDPNGIDYPYLTILDADHLSQREQQNQQGYYSPSNYLQLARYRSLLEQFAIRHAGKFDVILEKEWPWLGLFSEAFSPEDIPRIFLAEAVYDFKSKVSNPNLSLKQLINQTLTVGFNQTRFWLRKQWSRKATGIIAETEQLKSVLLAKGYARSDTSIYPIPYGINEKFFYPLDRDFCRQQLGIEGDRLVITYVGSLNRFIQEPAPFIEALGRENLSKLEMHIVGDGNKRQELEDLARSVNATVIFHGRVPQEKVPLYIGAANLCSAPYDKSLYPDQQFTCASLKIPEYLACGRPVLTIPAERMNDLLEGDQYGYQVENQVEAYRQFLRNFPSVETLQEKETQIIRDLENSALRAKRIVLTWKNCAEIYQEVIEELLSRQ